MAGLEQFSREQLLVVVTEQAAQIEVLTGQVAELTRRLAMNSQNSSMPPSKDGFVKPSRASRRASGRKPGKQPGAPGSALERVADPDEVIEHRPQACEGCGGGLAGADTVGVNARQVRDVPLVKVTVTEHRMHRLACGCGHVTAAPAPAGVDGPVVYGPNLRAIAVYLVVFQHVPVERAALLITDLTGAAVSTGWVSAQIARTADALLDVEALIKTLVALAAVIGVDETTINVGGVKQWLHVARTDRLTAYWLHPNRGRVAVDAFAVLPDYAGTVVHDALAVYDAYPARHALCGAHLLRELLAVSESDPALLWPIQARQALLALNSAARTARENDLPTIDADLLSAELARFTHAVLVGLASHPRAAGRKQTKARNLLERMRDRPDQILRFAHDLSVPFTNNGSERDLRPVKTQLKISGCHRASSGATNWLRVRGYISTVRKHQHDVLTALRDAIAGNPWQPPQPAT